MDELEEDIKALNIADNSKVIKILELLRRFLSIQQRRAEAYSRLRRGFAEYMYSSMDLHYNQLCHEIATEFNDCSKQVLEIELLLMRPDVDRHDLAAILRAVQVQEKKKLHLTARIQILKKMSRPSDQTSSHGNCRFIELMQQHEGVDETERDENYENTFNEAIREVQGAVTCINEYMEEVRVLGGQDVLSLTPCIAERLFPITHIKNGSICKHSQCSGKRTRVCTVAGKRLLQ